MTEDREATPTTTASGGTDVDAVVVGAGFAGLYLVHRLAGERGLSVRGFEAASGVGGTWYWNRYPGARTDSLHSIYRFSFSDELSEQWSFSERYPPRAEVLAYLEWVADRLDLRRHFRFGTRVVSAHWDAGRRHWAVTTDDGATTTARHLLTGLGLLTRPNLPDIPGLESFGGDWYHSASWPQPSPELAGKRVALIGTGSTGIQMVPHLAEAAGHLTVFQRTPNYVVPARNRPLTDAEQREFTAGHREIRDRIRRHGFAMPFTAEAASARAADERSRREIYQRAWDQGGFHFFFGAFEDLIVDRFSNETACEFIRSKIRETVTDPATAEALCPKGYPYGAKRPPAGSGYYETFNRDDVTLVDVHDDPITAFTPSGLRTATRGFDADVLVFATGFDATTGAYDQVDIRGRDGRSLADKWRAGPVSNLGLAVAGFPNLFMVSGPMSPFANMPTCIEENVDWIVAALDRLRADGLDSIESTEEGERAWTAHTQEVAAATVAADGAAVHSWFSGANVAGKARVVNLYFGGADNYFAACRAAAEDGYAGFTRR
jgi:cation diffusion facilitator CzcD-associated flavoprotein CzcO